MSEILEITDLDGMTPEEIVHTIATLTAENAALFEKLRIANVRAEMAEENLTLADERSDAMKADKDDYQRRYHEQLAENAALNGRVAELEAETIKLGNEALNQNGRANSAERESKELQRDFNNVEIRMRNAESRMDAANEDRDTALAERDALTQRVARSEAKAAALATAQQRIAVQDREIKLLQDAVDKSNVALEEACIRQERRGMELATAQQQVRDLRAALEGVLIRFAECRHCESIGVWEWDDPDGDEYLCDEHKNQNFYVNGPEEVDEIREALVALAATAEPEAQR